LQAQDASGLHRIDIHDGARDGLVLVKSTQPDAVVWNPWDAKSKARDYSKSFECIVSEVLVWIHDAVVKLSVLLSFLTFLVTGHG
jgi:hypothetical protein